MPKSRPNLAQAPSTSRFGSAPQPWDALKSELEDLLGQVQDQISEYDIVETVPRPARALHERTQSSNDDLEARRQEALLNVRSAVDRLGTKQERPKRKPKKKKKKRTDNDLETAIAQIRASTRRFEAEEPVAFSQSTVRDPSSLDHMHLPNQSLDISELTGQIEGLHRSVRDLASSVPGQDNFARIENQISRLSADIEEHKSPQANAIGDQLDSLQHALERLAELQVHQISHLEQLKAHDTNNESNESQQRIETSIRSIYEKFDTLEQSIDKPNGSIETIAKGIAGIARAVSDMQKRSETDQSQNILAHIESVSQRLAAMDNGQSGELTQDVRREMQGLRGQLVSALEPRFTALETRLDDFAAGAPVSEGGANYQHVTARIEKMEDRITNAIEGIASAQSFEDGVSNSPETLGALTAMEHRLTEALTEIRDAGTHANNGAEVSLETLKAMENRIGDAIARIPNIAKPTNDEQYDGLHAIENKLNDSLKRLEALSSTSSRATPNQESAATDDRDFAHVAIKQTPPKVPRAEKSPEASTPPAAHAGVAKSLPAHGMQKQSAEVGTPPTPASSLQNALQQVHTKESAVEPNAVPHSEEPTAQQTRESFIAAARRSTVARQETKSNPAGGLLGKALGRIKSLKQDKADAPTEELPKENTNKLATQLESPKDVVAEIPATSELPAQADLDHDARTLSVGPEPARPQSAVRAPLPKSALSDITTSENGGKDADELSEHSESFLTRNRQPILLAASVVAIIAMTANLVLDKGKNANNQDIPATIEGADVGEAPRQISLTEVETAISNAQKLPAEAVSLTSSTAMTDQSVGLVAPTPQLLDTQTVTASIPNSPVEVELPPTDLGPTALREAAANGDPRAQYEVGMIFAEGKAVPKDSQEAVKWYERSAASGFAAAQYRLGTAFEHGLGVSKDLDQAKLWYLRSAEAGNRMGMHNLAALHASGPDGERDFNAAARWFEEAAKRGVLDSQFNLGMLYARGLGVSQDFAQSFKWFSIAATNGDKDAQKARDDVARSLEPAQMSAIKQELSQWNAEPIDLVSNYAPIGTWDKSFNPGAEIKRREVVLGVQIALSKLGFDLGTPDGMMGPKTRDAIKQFERVLGMNESGTINPRLLTVLNGQPV